MRFIGIVSFVFLTYVSFAQTTTTVEPNSVRLVRGVSGAYKIVERSDWSRYENGKYVGHVYRETRANIEPSKISGNAEALEYRGHFYVLEETLRDLSRSARAVDEVVPAVFRVRQDGRLDVVEDRGFPSLRGFPSFPFEPVHIGSRWVAKGSRAVDPKNEGTPTLVPIIAEYEYRGVENYKGVPVHRIVAKYATRYKSTGGEGSFSSAAGTHDVDILIRADDGLPLLIRDRLDETFSWQDGATLRFKGFTLTFTENGIPMDHGAVVASVRKVFGANKDEVKPADRDSSPAKSYAPESAQSEKSGGGFPPAATYQSSDTSSSEAWQSKKGETLRAGTEAIDADGDFELAPEAKAAGIDVAETDAGIRMTVRDVRFAPDSDEILAAETSRLDLIAAALGANPERTILVEGHTAAIGKPSGELELSLLRAKRIVQELSDRGIAADRFLYKGWGGTKPIDTNTTESGRARNRRVEITILE